MVQSNQAKRKRKKTGHLLEWVKAIAPCLIIVMIGLGFLSYFFEREKEAAVRFLNIVKLLAEDSEVVRAGAVTAMGDFYKKYPNQSSQVLAYHLAKEEKALVRRAILNVLEQAGAEAIEPLVWMNRLLAKAGDWTVDSMKESLEEDSMHDFSKDFFSENLADIVTALATVLRKGGFPKDEKLDLSEVCLANQSSQGFIELDLREVNLEQANLMRACLIKVSLKKLKKANLSDALFFYVDLRGAFLQEAKLSPVRSVEVELMDANLTKADLTDAFLQRANMKGATLKEAGLTRADLSGANLTDAILTDAFLEGAKMEGATLKGADLRGANLIGATFDPRDIKEAKNWEKAIFDDSQRQKLGLTKINQ